MESALILPTQPRVYELRLDWFKIAQAIAKADERLSDLIMKMALLVPGASEVTMLKHIFNNLAPSDQTLKLFTNNTTPASGDTAATYTEMTTQGYTSKSLLGASASFTQANPSHWDYAQQSWTFDGTGGSTQVYGYFIVKTTGGLLLLTERFSDGPYVIVNNGDQIKITNTMTLG